jgi:ATP-binding protein involved in chromosome partitioning
VPESLEALVTAALARIKNPRLENDLLSAGMIRDLVAGADGRVSFTVLLTREDPATLVREARAAVKALEGVTEVKIRVLDPAGAPSTTHAPPSGGPQSAAAAVPPPPSPMELPNIGKVIAISSGKGGVGKSTVAANLAVALAQQGHRVGLMDGDIYGPNIPRMFGVFEKPYVVDGRIQPNEAWGVKLMSLGFLVERDAPAIWRGPIIMKVVTQFLRDVEWGQLDYLLVDMPPGTGDAQLSLCQATRVSGAVIVTTPQEVAVGDALRGAKMFERLSVPVLGIVENMSGYVCPHCGGHSDIFLSGGGLRLAEELGIPLLGQIPLQAGLADLADHGRPVVAAEPKSPAAQALLSVAEQVHQKVGGKSFALPILRG